MRISLSMIMEWGGGITYSSSLDSSCLEEIPG
jgi:hypothetical protein